MNTPPNVSLLRRCAAVLRRAWLIVATWCAAHKPHHILVSAKLWTAMLAIVLLVYVAREIRRDALIIDAFSVPPRYTETGITGDVFANRTADEMRRIEGFTHTITQADHLISSKDSSIADIEIPGTSLGLKAVVDVVRSMLETYPTRVTGHITLKTDFTGAPSDTATVTLYVDKKGERTSPILVSAHVTDVDALAAGTALQIVKAINPYLYAAYETHRHHYADAVSAIESIILNPAASNTARKEAYSLWGVILSNQGKFEDAVNKYTTATELDPQFAAAYNNWGVALERQNKFEDAVKQFQAAINRDAKFTAAYDNWGLLLAKKSLYADAILKYQEAARHNALDSRTYDCWGAALVAQAKSDEAVSQFKTALSINPADATAYRSWADILAKQKRSPDAITLYRKAVAADPEDPNLHLAFGNVLRLMERHQDAIDQYSLALAIDPEFIPAYNNKGIVLAVQKHYDEAIADYQKALELDARYAPAYDNWGEALSGQNKFKEAIAMYKKAIDLDPTLTDAYENAATAYSQQGDTENASLMHQQARALQSSGK